MKKQFELKVKAKSLISPEPKLTTEELLEKIKHFGVSDPNDSVTITLGFEDFLMECYLEAAVPIAPLKAYTHKMKIDKIASKLALTCESENLPDLTEEELDMIRSLMSDDEFFKGKVLRYAVLSESKTTVVTLPAANICFDKKFLTLIAHLFGEKDEAE